MQGDSGSGEQQPRRQERAVIGCQCEIKIGNRQWHMARLLDLTPDGFRLSLTDMPAVGTKLRIRLPGISIMEAEVCWARNFEAGCKFSQPLSPYVFEHFVRQSGN
ncbi:MAG TPA: PilZ domain-containing protein [Erythrobacter sp.]|nr:PilZ domain-containing protein [Erythrobacter sp.]